jgi:hypothetical protein
MHRVVLIILLLSVSACAVLPENDRVSAVVTKPITLNWGIRQDNPGHLAYQHEGIPGNIASLPKTLTPQNRPLAVIVLGDPVPSGARIGIEILGVHELASSRGMVSTIIAARDSSLTLEALEQTRSGSLAVIEAGLVQLADPGSRSLGFRSVQRARQTIASARQACRRIRC